MKGFTLVEVVIAMAVLVIGVLALASAASVAARLGIRGRRSTQAAVLAAQRMETLRSQPCLSLVAGAETVANARVVWTVAATAGGRGRRLLVSVTWPEARAVRVESFATTIACAAGDSL